MIPKIIFKYSDIYNQKWQTSFQVYRQSPKNLSPEKIKNYIKAIEKIWKKYEKIILQELPKIVKLKWQEKKIICYVVSDCNPFSDPLTLSVCKNKNTFIDILTHELIHQLLSQGDNYIKAKKSWKYINNKYKNQSRLTKIHIIVHAIHWHIYDKLFNKERLNRNINRTTSFSDYKNAWEIVKKDGYENIIKEFNSRIIK